MRALEHAERQEGAFAGQDKRTETYTPSKHGQVTNSCRCECETRYAELSCRPGSMGNVRQLATRKETDDIAAAGTGIARARETETD